MKELDVVTLPILEENRLKGLVTIGDVAKSYFEMYDSDILSVAHTSLRNIVDTLSGEIVTGDPDKIFEKGKKAYFIVSSYFSGKICRHS